MREGDYPALKASFAPWIKDLTLLIPNTRALGSWSVLAAATSCAITHTTPGAPDPIHIGPVSRFAERSITESSGVAVSRQFPGVIWTHNDGGSGPLVYATDTMGRNHGSFVVADVRNIDWEAMAIGACGDHQCLYLGDVGDNKVRRESVTIYRIREPTPQSPVADSALPIAGVERLEFRYPDGPRDVEAMYVDPGGGIYLITKTTKEAVLRYRLPATWWDQKDSRTAEPLGPFPIDPGTSRLAAVTGADLSLDGSMLVVRTYRELFFYAVEADGHVGDGPMATCPILGIESQGEAVAWLDDRRVVLTSERGVMGRGTIMVVHCQLSASASQTGAVP